MLGPILPGWVWGGTALLLIAWPANGDLNTTPTQRPPLETGLASYYAPRYQGRTTASGEIFDQHQLTAAHPRLKFGTRVKVTNLNNHCSVQVRINDRGPFVPGRVIDLSWAAASQLQLIQSGLATVSLEIVGP